MKNVLIRSLFFLMSILICMISTIGQTTVQNNQEFYTVSSPDYFLCLPPQSSNSFVFNRGIPTGGVNNTSALMSLFYSERYKTQLRLPGTLFILPWNNPYIYNNRSLQIWTDDTVSKIESINDIAGLRLSSQGGNKITLGDDDDSVYVGKMKVGVVPGDGIYAKLPGTFQTSDWQGDINSPHFAQFYTDANHTVIRSYGDPDGLFLHSQGGNKIFLGDENDLVTINGFNASATDSMYFNIKNYNSHTGIKFQVGTQQSGTPGTIFQLTNFSSFLSGPYHNSERSTLVLFPQTGNASSIEFSNTANAQNEKKGWQIGQGIFEKSGFTIGKIDAPHNGAKFNLDDSTAILNCTGSDNFQLSINTDAKVNNATLTVAGATYIGPNAEKASNGQLTKFNPSYLSKYNLWVEDGIVTEDIAIVHPDQWRDYVFDEKFKLRSLPELEQFIKAYKHLPDVPSEKEILEKGYTLHKMNKALIQKVEELTLYAIEQQKEIEELKRLMKEIYSKINMEKAK